MRTMRHFALGLMALAPLGQAQALDLSDTFALQISPTVLSDYRSSGISQTLGDPAMHLDVLLSHASGLSAGKSSASLQEGSRILLEQASCWTRRHTSGKRRTAGTGAFASRSSEL